MGSSNASGIQLTVIVFLSVCPCFTSLSSSHLPLTQAVGGTADYFPDGQGGKPWNNKDEHAVNAFWNAKGQWSVIRRTGAGHEWARGRAQAGEMQLWVSHCPVLRAFLRACPCVRSVRARACRLPTWREDDVAMKIDWVRIYGI